MAPRTQPARVAKTASLTTANTTTTNVAAAAAPAPKKRSRPAKAAASDDSTSKKAVGRGRSGKAQQADKNRVTKSASKAKGTQTKASKKKKAQATKAVEDIVAPPPPAPPAPRPSPSTRKKLRASRPLPAKAPAAQIPTAKMTDILTQAADGRIRKPRDRKDKSWVLVPNHHLPAILKRLEELESTAAGEQASGSDSTGTQTEAPPTRDGAPTSDGFDDASSNFRAGTPHGSQQGGHVNSALEDFLDENHDLSELRREMEDAQDAAAAQRSQPAATMTPGPVPTTPLRHAPNADEGSNTDSSQVHMTSLFGISPGPLPPTPTPAPAPAPARRAPPPPPSSSPPRDPEEEDYTMYDDALDATLMLPGDEEEPARELRPHVGHLGSLGPR